MAIGFGISNAEQAKEISLKGDAVVTGSAYVIMILETSNPREREEKNEKAYTGLR